MQNKDLYRQLATSINEAYQGRQYFFEAIVLEQFKKSNKIKVKLLGVPKMDNGVYVRMSYPLASNNVKVGALPAVGSHVLVIDASPPHSTQYSNLIYHSSLYDDNNVAPEEENESQDDKDYFVIKPKNGDVIEMYVSSEDNKNIIKLKSGGNITIYADEQVNVIAQRVRIGTDNEANTEEVVLKSHLAKYDGFVDEFSTFLTNLQSSAWVTMLGVLPFAAITAGNPAFLTSVVQQSASVPLKKDNNTNISSITKIDKK
jgi:hypothetical protein